MLFDQMIDPDNWKYSKFADRVKTFYWEEFKVYFNVFQLINSCVNIVSRYIACYMAQRYFYWDRGIYQDGQIRPLFHSIAAARWRDRLWRCRLADIPPAGLTVADWERWKLARLDEDEQRLSARNAANRRGSNVPPTALGERAPVTHTGGRQRFYELQDRLVVTVIVQFHYLFSVLFHI